MKTRDRFGGFRSVSSRATTLSGPCWPCYVLCRWRIDHGAGWDYDVTFDLFLHTLAPRAEWAFLSFAGCVCCSRTPYWSSTVRRERLACTSVLSTGPTLEFMFWTTVTFDAPDLLHIKLSWTLFHNRNYTQCSHPLHIYIWIMIVSA